MENNNKNKLTKGLSTIILSSGILIGSSFISDVPFSSIEVAAATTTTTKTTYKTTADLNLRSTNSTSGKVLVVIPKGKAVTYVSKSGNWYKVKYSGKTGWVSSTYIKATKTTTTTTTTYKTTASLNLRSTNSTSGKVLLVIPKGRAVTYVSKSGNWYKVKYSGKTGWVSASYIKVTKSTTAAKTTATKTTYTTTNSLNLRSTNSTSGKVLLVIPKGKAVTYVSKSGNWYKVTYGGKTGWVQSSYIKVATSSTATTAASTTTNTTNKTATTSTKSYTTTADLNLRNANSTSGKVLLVIPKGKAVTYTSKSGDWYKVTYNGKTGWVSSTYIKVSTTTKTDTTSKTETAPKTETTTPKTDTVPKTETTTPKTETAPKTDTTDKTETTNKATYTTTADLNLRDAGSLDGKILLVIPSGKEVSYISTSGDWYKVTYEGKTGWVSSNYIKVSNGSTTNSGTSSTSPTGTNTPVLGSSSVTAPTGQTITTMMVYNGDALTLRASSSASSTSLGTIPANVKLATNYKTTNGWYWVAYNGKTGFVSGNYLISETEKARIDNLEKNKNSYLFMDLRTESSVTAAQINTYIKNSVGSRTSVLLNSGKYFIDAGKKYGVNALYLAAHAIHESGFGTSQISIDRNNLFGYGAYDLVPYIGSVKFASIQQNIEFIAQKMKTTYLGNSWHNQGTFLGYSTKSITGVRVDALSKGMNFYYATDTNWGNGIATHMTKMLDYSKEGATKKAPNTTIPVNPGYPDLSDVFPSGTLAVAKSTLYLYNSKSTSNGSVTTIPVGATFNLLGKDNNYWLKVKYKNKTYYVAASSYFHQYNSYFTVKNLARVTASGLNVRKSASGAATIITTLNNKDYIELALENNVPVLSNGWYKIVINGSYGWVSSTYVTRELNK